MIDYLTKSLGIIFIKSNLKYQNENSVDLISVIYTDTENLLFFIH